ncbi:MAG: hypothetical protein ACRDQA_02725 [Nocardioidaceae bacterium]
MDLTLGLVLVLATFPALLIIMGVVQLRARRGPRRVAIQGVVQQASQSYRAPHMTVAYPGPDGDELTGESTEGFTGAHAGDPITVWVNPEKPQDFSICDPAGSGAALAFGAILLGVVMLVLLARVAEQV